MSFKRAFLLSTILAVSAVLGPLHAETEPAQDRTFLVLRGTVASVEDAVDSQGETWTDAVLVTAEDRSSVRIRVAPSRILESEGLRIAVGDTLHVRVFSDESPFGVQRVRNESTGRALRVRCLHGEPIWDSGRGRGNGGPRHRGGR